MEKRYSRKFEQEADRYAVHVLQSQHIEVEQMIRILRLLEQTHRAGTEFDYLSTHPAMGNRIGLIESLQTEQR